MNNTARVIIVALVVAICIWFLSPTLVWYGTVSSTDKELALGTNSQIRDFARGQASKGLRSIKALDPSVLIPEEYAYLNSLVTGSKKGNTVEALFKNATDSQIFATIEKEYRDTYMGYKKASQNSLQLGLDLRGGLSILLDVDVAGFEQKIGRSATEAEISAAIDKDIEVLKTRIDQFGVTEPEIRKQGNNQILIEVSGEADPERVESFIRGKGALSFQLVDVAATKKANDYFANHPDELYADDGSFVQPDWLAEGTTLTGYFVRDAYNIDELKSLSVIYDYPSVDGALISNATQDTDQVSGKPVVNFTLTTEGGKQMYDITSGHVGDMMAVVMDGKVKSQANIRDVLSTSIQISGFTQSEAQDLAVTLQTSSMPIGVSVASQRTIGASLGEDSVRVATLSIIAGFCLVVLFMFAYYGLSGLVADLGLVVNMFMIISVLGGFKSTFTLTGIAGLILTLGMAVDSNVIIFERIKELMKEGMSPRNAVEGGYKRAFWTIMDSNLTTMIAAVVLIVLGSSAVKGFAVTLAIGIVSSLFCSLLFCHLLMSVATKNKLHIGWRKING